MIIIIIIIIIILSERKVSWHVCVSGSGVGQSAGLVVCDCMVPGSALGGILAFLWLCSGLPSFVIIIILLIIVIIMPVSGFSVSQSAGSLV